VRYAFIREHVSEFPTLVMCRVLQVSRSGYYSWLKRKPSNQAKRRKELAQSVEKSFHGSHEIYGYRKVHEDLVQEEKIEVCKETVRSIMCEKALRSKVKRKFVVTTNSDHKLPKHENLLDRDFTADRPNRKWAADITYVRTSEGWLYLAAVMDLFSRRIVGWSLSKHIDTQLVSDALKMAILHRCPDKDLMHHSDQGVQYAAEDFQDLLDANGISCSMSRKGNCWDNACMESFFGKLKNEHIRKRIYKTRIEAEQNVFWYIEVFYNRQRRHASLGYVSPAKYEARAITNRAA